LLAEKLKGSVAAPLVFVLVAGVGFEPTTSGLLARQVGTIQIVSNKMTFCYAFDESQIPSQKLLNRFIELQDILKLHQNK